MLDTVNTKNDSCRQSPLIPAWVGQGYAIQVGHSGVYYFWEDCRGGGVDSGVENLHWLYQMGSSDNGVYFGYYIEQGSLGNGVFNVVSYVPGGSQRWSYQSTSNPMKTNLLQIGEETTTTSSTSAFAYYTAWQWRSTVNGSWNYQTNAGNPNPSNGNPPYFTWTTPPSNSYPGGLGHANCC